jgi:hypothetical protein
MSNATHLSAETLARYRARTLCVDELLTATAHLADCDDCRARVAGPEPYDKLLDAFAGPHLEYEALEELVRGDGVHEHLSLCGMCAKEYEDLKAFRSSLIPPARRNYWGWSLLIPVAAAIAFLAIHPSKPAPPKPAAAELRDNGRAIFLTAEGKLQGVTAVSPEESASLIAVLQTGEIPRKPAEPDLVRNRETLLGGDSGAVALRPLSPVGTVVLSTQPVFRWQAPPTAREVHVEIYDEAFELAAAMPSLNGQTWSPAEPLARGRTYTWTISAVIVGKRVMAPAAPEPEAKFRVATAEEAAQMTQVLDATPQSQLRVAVTAARLGFIGEARMAAARLAAENPGSPLAARLQASLNK